ncbi:Oligopeptide transporter 5 [Apostasia shenzhenica]|uniref:Oligopeptide transporter 5 n=1 Tax=Apostasia shenzhenica TaxID=1088818 RepID=A0A2I0AJX4_9ASPA|nr:Oligopeptide transporter 5 [Apostasia shenzhenica]
MKSDDASALHDSSSFHHSPQLKHSQDGGWQVEENDHPIEQVRLTVEPTDNPNIPVATFRTWVIGVTSCIALSFVNMFFGYRSNQLSIGSVCVQIISLPIGRFLASTLPRKEIKIPFIDRTFSLNPGPFSMKEHCLISIFAGAGAGGLYAVHVITVVKAFYRRDIHPMAGFLLAQTTQLLGFGWAGIYRKYLVESPYMWWPANLVQVSLFRALHQKEKRKKGRLTGFQFFLIVFITSFAYYAVPGFLFPVISTISVLCLAFKNSVTMQQIGSGQRGLGVGSFGLDWATVAGFLGSPLATPASAIFNIIFSFFLGIYVLIPIGYWTNTYSAKSFPIMSSNVFDYAGRPYNITRIINDATFTLNAAAQDSYSKINLSIMFCLTYGLGFASLTASITHVALHHGRDIWQMWRKTQEYAKKNVEDVHTRLMRRNYDPVPQWWFLLLLLVVIALSIYTCLGFDGQLQLPWWGVLFACAMALFFTLPIGVIMATTNQAPGLNVLTQYVMGLMLPGKPLANVTFKTYGTVSILQALTLLSDLNLGHYMKIPPRSMFISQLAGTVIAAAVYFGTAWMLLSNVKNICDTNSLPPGSPWTCPNDNVFYNASIIWGLVGPIRMFGRLGHYSTLNYFFLIGFLLPIPFWFLSNYFPKNKWLKHIHVPLIVSGAGGIPPAHTVNYIMWGAVGIFFNYYVYERFKGWWAKHNYVMSAALDAGVAFMAILIFFSLQLQNISGIDWWGGAGGDYCDLASCPTAPGIAVRGCPVVE